MPAELMIPRPDARTVIGDLEPHGSALDRRVYHVWNQDGQRVACWHWLSRMTPLERPTRRDWAKIGMDEQS